jgi:hypothetical protein
MVPKSSTSTNQVLLVLKELVKLVVFLQLDLTRFGEIIKITFSVLSRVSFIPTLTYSQLIVVGYAQWTTLADLKDADEDEKFLKADWLDEPDHVESYVESVDNGWVARQIWGFAEVRSEGQTVRKYVRRVVVKKGKDVKRARLVYDHKPEETLLT